MEKQEAQNLAEKIALLLQENGKESDDFADLRVSLRKINQRLDEIENKLASHNPTYVNPSSFNLPPSKTHPSQEKFDIAEIIADEIIGNLQNEKACPYEPTGKPCDHCSMCSSRGF